MKDAFSIHYSVLNSTYSLNGRRQSRLQCRRHGNTYITIAIQLRIDNDSVGGSTGAPCSALARRSHKRRIESSYTSTLLPETDNQRMSSAQPDPCWCAHNMYGQAGTYPRNMKSVFNPPVLNRRFRHHSTWCMERTICITKKNEQLSNALCIMTNRNSDLRI